MDKYINEIVKDSFYNGTTHAKHVEYNTNGVLISEDKTSLYSIAKNILEDSENENI